MPLMLALDMHAVAPNVDYFARIDLWWMMANTILGLIPWMIAYAIFQPAPRSSRHPVAIVGNAVAIGLFLLTISYPLYVLSDVIHLPYFIEHAPSPFVGAAMAIPAYTVTFTVGFVVYIDCVRRARAWVMDRSSGRLHPAAIDLPLHVFAIAGIIVGRVTRFQVWDAVLAPGYVARESLGVLTEPGSLVAIVAATALLYLVGRREIPLMPTVLHRFLPGRARSMASAG